MAPKLRPLVAAVDGVINWVQYPQPDWGYAISIRDAKVLVIGIYMSIMIILGLMMG